MLTTLLLVYTLQLLEKVNISFLWGDSASSHKLHAIAWNKVCQPKDGCGLGLKPMNEINHLPLAHVMEPGSPLVQIIECKIW